MYRKFKGTGVAIVTPFHKDGSVDFKSLEKVIEHIIAGKAEYLVPLGTTGESVTLNKEEKSAVMSCVVEVVNKRVPVVLGLGGNNTQEIIHSFKQYSFDGVDAILSVAPYYNKPTQKGLFEHFRMISNSSPVPVILYNIPGRTGSNMTAETTLKIATDCRNVIGIKEASGNLEQCMTIIKNKPEHFLVLSGDDGLCLPLVALGGDGVISVAANAFPSDVSEMTRQALKGNFKKAQELHYKLLDLVGLLFVEGNPAGIKAALNILGLCNDKLRLPLTSVSKQTYNKIAELMKSNQ